MNERNDPYLIISSDCHAGLPNQHTLSLSGLVTDTADHWRTQYFGASATNSGNAADTANPTGDGITNLLKYALGLNPQASYPPGTVSSIELDSNGHLSMTVTKNPAAADVTLAIEVASDLTNPSSWSTAGTTVDQNTLTTLQAHDNTPVSGAPSRFIRLKVTRP